MIPENKQVAVKNALQRAFGSDEIESIRPLTSGLSSALVFQIAVKGKAFLLKVIISTDAMSDPGHQFACMEIAAEAGITPAIHYMSAEDRILITDFVEVKPFPLSEAKDKLAGLLRQLHSLAPFPRRFNYLDRSESFIQKFQASKILPESATKEVFQLYAPVTGIYSCLDKDMVSCHNDLKPENILFDGIRPWLADWDATCLNDRYVDLAIVANFVVTGDRDEADFLGNYFGEVADEYKHARFFLMSQIVHMFYFTVFMLVGWDNKPINPGTIRPGFRDFHDRIWKGEISLAGNEARIQYALVHMDRLLDNLRSKRFEDSLQIVSKCPSLKPQD